MQNTPEREIDLMNLLFALWRRLWVIVGCAVVVGVASLIITYCFITPMYRASVSIYVDNRTAVETDGNYISSSTLSAAQRLVKTYVTIIESNTVLEEVIEEGELNMTPVQIRRMMSASSVNDTEIFRIYISNADPEVAAQVANAIANVAPGQISEFLAGSSTKVIDFASVPSEPYAPNYIRNITLGLIIGALISAAVICIITIMDVRIKDEEELERVFDIPVLGSVPAFELGKNAKSTYSYEESRKGAGEL